MWVKFAVSCRFFLVIRGGFVLGWLQCFGAGELFRIERDGRALNWMW